MPKSSSGFVRHDAVPEAVVVTASRNWAARLRASRPELVRIGYFGSYARGDYVPSSDFDALIIVSRCDVPRLADRVDPYRPDDFPVGMNLFVYAEAEIEAMRAQGSAFLRTIESEVRWLDADNASER